LEIKELALFFLEKFYIYVVYYSKITGVTMRTFFLKAALLFLVALASSAMAQRTLYFLPPFDPDWMRKTPHVLDLDVEPSNTGESGTDEALTAMRIDPALCGWYRLSGSSVLNSRDVVIWQGFQLYSDITRRGTNTDRIGVEGLDESSVDWTDEFVGKGSGVMMPKVINLDSIFNALGSTVYFDPSKGRNGWSNLAPSSFESKRCNYSMAGLIYDTDIDVTNGSFTKYRENDGAGSWIGIRRGIVESKLTKNSKGISKMRWNNPTGSNAANWNKTDFDNAFECKSGVNALVCYDVPFKRDIKGLWTFSSDFLCADNTVDLQTNPANRYFTKDNATTLAGSLCSGHTGKMLSFAPDRLNGYNGFTRGVDDKDENGNTKPLDPNCTYALCSKCANINTSTAEPDGAEPVTPFNDKVNPDCYEKGQQSTSPTSACGSTFNDGQLGDGENPGIWDWGVRNNIRTHMYNRQLNSFFCFETHATFVYEKGQEFYFSGDDDIWVFINDNLVIDLGGSHLAAPGYVNLDSIGRGGRWQSMGTPLVRGNEYPLDIFFCDRRTNASNIRISTNMYISQETGIFVEDGSGSERSPAQVCVLKSGSGGNCASLLGGSGATSTMKECGKDNYNMDQYLTYALINRRGTDTLWIYPERGKYGENCNLSGGILTCYGGIKIDLAKGYVSIVDAQVRDLAGTWNVYAFAPTLNPEPDPVKVAQYQAKVLVRTAWGEIKDNGQTVIRDLCKQNVTATTGELKPICFASGDIGSGGTYVIDSDESGGSTFRLAAMNDDRTSAFAKLNIFLDSNGVNKVGNPVDTTFSLPKKGQTIHGSGSVAGVLVLWVSVNDEGMIQPDRNKEYKFNVTGKAATEDITFNSVVPFLEWVMEKPAGTKVAVDLACDNRSSKCQSGGKWNTDGDPTSGVKRKSPGGPIDPLWVGDPVTLNLRAYRQEGSNRIYCKTCNIRFDFEAGAPASTTTQTGRGLISADPLLQMKNGEMEFRFSGLKEVKTDNPGASITLKSMYSALSYATWDSLFFEKPPVPIPEVTEIYDIDGDGIGDSLRIIYNRGFKQDSLPTKILVYWDTVAVEYGIGIGVTASDGKTTYRLTDIDKNKNKEYWVGNGFLKPHGGISNLEGRGADWDLQLDELKDTIYLRREPSGAAGSIVKFSDRVLTKSPVAKIINWASFKASGSETHNGFEGTITDKIPAIITAATYKAGDNCSGQGTKGSECFDEVVLQFSEPVFKDNVAGAELADKRNPFAYKFVDLGSEKFEILKIDGSDLPIQSMRFSGSKTVEPSDAGDSVVTLVFKRYRQEGNNSRTPMPGDTVKFASVNNNCHIPDRAENDYAIAKNIFIDRGENMPNPCEIGARIEGRKPFTQEKIAVAEVDPNNPDAFKPGIGSGLADAGSDPGRFGEILNDMFTTGRPVEILPVHPEWNNDRVREKFPGTVGMVLSPDIFNEIADMEKSFAEGGLGLGPIPDEAIVFDVKVFYHTNLGSYVADRAFSLKCNDPVFPIGKSGEPSCRENKNKIYIAWDMKDFKGRFVGTGAYVGLYDFRWGVRWPEQGVNKTVQNIERKVEMHGVKRTKVKR